MNTTSVGHTQTRSGMARCAVCRSVRRVEGRVYRHMYRDTVSWPTAKTTCCNRPMRVEEINGTVTNTICDSRCTRAKGHNCDCSCGGKNHGVSYA